MKKVVLTTTVLLSSLILGTQTVKADETIAPLKEEHISLPSMDIQTVTKLKEGRYEYKGLKIGDKYHLVKKDYGQFNYSYTENNPKGKYMITEYGKSNPMLLMFYSRNKNISNENIRLTEMTWNALGKGLLKKDIEKITGKATYSKGNMKNSVVIRRDYKHLKIIYSKDLYDRQWKVYSISQIAK